MNLEKGRVYRAKKPGNCGGYYNDRHVLYLSSNVVQYDGPAVASGRRYPKVARDVFERWVGDDVTDKLPEGKWQRYGHND